jgi:hypothetical protein
MRVHCSATLGPDEGSSPLVTTDIPAPHLNSHTDTVLSSKQATAVLLEWRLVLHYLATIHLRGHGQKQELRL